MRWANPIWFIAFWTLLAFFLIGGLNHAVGGLGFALHLQALLIIFIGLHLNDYSGFPLVCALAFLEASARGLDPGLMLAAYGALWLFFIWCRRRMHRTNPNHLGIAAMGGQFLFILMVTAFHSRDQIAIGAFQTTLLVELLLSLGVIYLVSPAWCRFQKNILLSHGWNPDAQLNKL